jgi:acetyl-CoA C-acetyltransferase
VKKSPSLGLKPLAYIKGYADAAQEPNYYNVQQSITQSIRKAGISISDVDYYFESNEVLLYILHAKILGLDNSKNANGGVVSAKSTRMFRCKNSLLLIKILNKIMVKLSSCYL